MIPWMLDDKNKSKRLTAALSKRGEFIADIVHRDETWVSFATPETNWQSIK